MKKMTIKQQMLLAAGALVSGSVFAQSASEAMESISNEATSMATAAWPIATAIVVAVIGIKLFKKFANKAT